MAPASFERCLASRLATMIVAGLTHRDRGLPAERGRDPRCGIAVPVKGGGLSVATADLDGDGAAELVVAGL